MYCLARDTSLFDKGSVCSTERVDDLNMDIKIIVAAHKEYWMPNDPMYLPLQVGSIGKPSLHPEWLRDDAGVNISNKNLNFCELTALYWAWKNLDSAYVGITHYRRYFACRLWGDQRTRIATKPFIERKLQKADVILPRKRHYWIETNYSQYAHAHHEVDLLKTKEILAELCPEYLPHWESVMRRTSGHRLNMLVFRRELLDAYCGWLFPLLFELEKRLDISSYSRQDARVFGFISERMLDIWLEKNGIRYASMPVVHLENKHWPKKIGAFLKRKMVRGRRCT